ncbi:putative Sec7 domain [Prochlorococcus sp. MIT 0702]|nr:putative Sec7 domain [Prochlorococcus sp. MIT 0702]KGG28169.1 putative Sec7 domain [Prochlorococcus sp. MIT 0701]KGG37219.1 putative Sec7 domain [Prochlorococcus sp. MIT 0703]
MDLNLRQNAEPNKFLHGYGQVLKELENAGEALEEAFEENGSWGVFSGSTLVEAVRAFIQTFRLAMDQAKEARLTKREATKEVVDINR